MKTGCSPRRYSKVLFRAMPLLFLTFFWPRSEAVVLGEVELEPVVVTASRIPQSVTGVPLNVTVLDHSTLRQSPALVLDDTLRAVPGFGLFRRSGSLSAHPTSQGVSLRGIGPSGAGRTLVLWDGFPLNDPFGGWVQWGQVPLVAVDRLEIVRGGGSTAWGSSALGGVIQIFSDPPGASTSRLEGMAGERKTRRGAFLVSAREQPWTISFHGQRFETDGFPIVKDDRRGEVDVPLWSNHVVMNATVGRSFPTGAVWLLRTGMFSEERGNGTPLTGNETDSLRVSSSLRWGTAAGDNLEWLAYGGRVDFSSRFSSVSSDRSLETPVLDQFSVPSDVIGTALTWNRHFGDGHHLNAGADFRQIRGETNEDYLFLNGSFRNRRVAGGSQLLGGVFMEDNWEVVDGWIISAGGRLDYWKNHDGRLLERNLQAGTDLNQETFSSRDGAAFHPRVGLRGALSPGLSLRGAAYQGFRVPTLNELYRPFRVGNDITRANPALDIERLTGFETGIDLSREERMYGKLTLFRTLLKDPVANVTLETGEGGGVLRERRNLGRAVVQGFEMDGSVRLSPWWEVGAGYLFSHAEVKNDRFRGELEGKRLAQSPLHQATLFSKWNWNSQGTLRIHLRYLGSQYEDDLNTRKLPAHWVADLFVERALAGGARLFAGVGNLFDQTQIVGLSAEGLETVGAPRLFHAGFRWEL